MIVWNNVYYHNEAVSFPVSYYKGYNVYFIDENSNVTIEKAIDDMVAGLVKVNIPDNFNGKIIISYDGTKIQKISSVVSVMTLFGTLLYTTYKKLRKLKNE